MRSPPLRPNTHAYDIEGGKQQRLRLRVPWEELKHELTLAQINSTDLRGVTRALAITALCGCAASHVALVGRARPPTTPDQVRIYLQPPDGKYEQIANVSASSSGTFAITATGKMDKVIERLKREAAKVGANGILLHGVGNETSESAGAGITTEMDSGHSPYGLGFGVSAFFYGKSGDGVAIYVETQ
ncbi:MAG: hypothetical protein ABJD53_06930 [Gammaproteobacteria bacterium]